MNHLESYLCLISDIKCTPVTSFKTGTGFDKTFEKWASSWNYVTYHIGDQRRLRRSLTRIFAIAHMKYGSRQRVRPKIRHLAPMDGRACVRTAKALARLRGCVGSPEPSLVAHVISTIISWAGSFDNTFTESRIPMIWKDANVSAVYKIKADKSETTKYRPASLTCLSSRLWEKTVRDTIMNHMNENSLFLTASMDLDTTEGECVNNKTYWMIRVNFMMKISKLTRHIWI